jgi:diguanylate cyclase (GGDEF)-like protein
LYIILVTGRGQTEDLVTGMEAGADDYLVKPFSSGELRARLRAGERMVRIQQQLRDDGERSAALARTDELTGLPNRRAVLQRLDEEMDRTGREGRPLSAILVDVDGFKRVNDGFGHAAGDDVLVEFARRLRAKVRSYDVVARIGGDEFLVLLPGATQRDAISVAERLREAIESAPFGAKTGHAHRVTASLGVAPVMAMSSEGDLLAGADAALYVAKNNGGNQVSGPTSAGDPHTSETISVAARR